MEHDYQSDLYHVGDRIRELREIRGWSQEELADRMEMSTSTLYRFETGKRSIPIDLFFRLSDVMGISVCDLVPGRFMFGNKTDCYNTQNEYNRLSIENKKVVDTTMATLVHSLLSIE